MSVPIASIVGGVLEQRWHNMYLITALAGGLHGAWCDRAVLGSPRGGRLTLGRASRLVPEHAGAGSGATQGDLFAVDGTGESGEGDFCPVFGELVVVVVGEVVGGGIDEEGLRGGEVRPRRGGPRPRSTIVDMAKSL
ncbi:MULTISPECIES: hypothetical protein [unclassified Streptomyces]|uniref:hypothetical protein n=1 Tax=unclassified Streptomyces TaxID=2593676 RepID=UPI003406CD48